MAKDAEIKLNLNIKEFIQNLKAVGPELQKALNIRGEIAGVEEYQRKLKATADTAEMVNKRTGKLKGAYDVSNLEKWETELKDIIATTEELNTVNEKLKNLGFEDGVDKDKRLASLRGAIGGARGEGNKKIARDNYNEANSLLAQRKTLITTINTQYDQLNAQQKQHLQAIEEANKVVSEQRTNVEAINTKYDENVARFKQANVEEQKGVDTTKDKNAAIGEENKLTDETANAEKRVADTANQATDAIKSATQASGELNEKTKRTSADSAIKKIAEDSDKADTELQDLIDRANKLDEAMKVSPEEMGIVKMLQLLQEAESIYKGFKKQKLPDMAAPEIKATVDNMGRLQGYVSAYNRELRKVASTTKTVASTTDDMKGRTKSAGNTGVDAGKQIAKAWKTTKSTLNGIGKLVSEVKRGFSSVSRVGDKVKSSFNNMARSMRSNFKHMLTSITKYVLGFRSLFFLVRRLRKYIGEGIQNLAKFNDGNNIVNESITDMLSSLLYLKNAWAAAFSPIITYVRPILVSLIDSLADVGNAIARFLSALFGQEIAFNAVRVRAQDYADSLDNAGGSASGAADKVKKLTDRLAAFDDLNVLGVDNDPDGTGSGGGGGIADEYVPDPNEMFKIVDPEQNGLLAMLKKAWETADFSPVGEAIKVKLIGVFQNIDWEDIKDKAGRFGTGAGSFVAGLFGDPKLFEEAGKTIGEGLNTVTTAISDFLDETEGVDFGGNLAKGFNEFLRTTDWETMGENISRTFTQVTDNINSFLDTLDDEELEKSIHDFIMKLDLPKLLADAGKTTIKLLGKLTIITVDIVKALGESLGDNLILYAQAKVQVTQLTQQGYDENGRPIEVPVYIEPEYDWTEHPFKALIEKILTDIGSFGVDVIFNVEGEEDLQKLIDLWLPIFGDNGDFFRVMDVIAGVIQGNPGKWITGVFGDNKDLEDLRTALDAIITIIRPLDAFAIADMFRDVDFGQLKEDIEKDFEGFSWGDLFGSIFGSSDLDDDGSSGKIGMVKDSWNSLGETSEKTYQKVKGDFKLLDTDLSEIWTTIQTTAETTATTLYDNLTTKWGEIKGSAYEKFVGVKTNITDKLQEAKDSAEEKIETLKTNLTNKWQEIKGNIYEKLVGIKTNVLTVFDQLKEAIKTPVNGFIDIIESMVNKVIYGINLLTSALNSLPDITMTNPFTGTEYALGFTIPSLNYVDIPRLAQGAVIPPNREFMAVLGDQSHGTNIEAPLDTIKQAVAEVVANNGNEEVINLLQQLITVVESKNLVIGDKEIGKANARYVNQQKLIRGTSI